VAVNVGTLRLNLAVDLKAFDSGLRAAERSLDKTAKQFNTIGSALSKTITLPVLGAAAAVAKLGSDFESQMHKIEGLLGASSGEVAGFSKAILEMAGPTARAPKELAAAMDKIVDAGFKGAQAVDILRASAKAAAAGLGETSRIADTVTVALNAYAREHLSAAQATSILIAAAREGRGSLEELQPAFNKVGPVAAQLGVRFNEVAASIAVMTNAGLEAGEAASTLQRVLSVILRPSADAQRALREMGLSADGLRRQIADKGLLSALQTLEGAFKGDEAAIAQVFPGMKALGGTISLLGQDANKARAVFQTLASTGVGDLDRAFSTIQKDAAFKFQRALAEIQAIGIELWGTLRNLAVPALDALGSSLKGIQTWLTGMDSDMRNLVLVLAVVGAAAGPAALGMSAFFKALSGGFAILRAMTALIFGLTLPVLQAVAVTAVFAAAAIFVYNRWRAMAEGLQIIWEAIADSCREVFQIKVFAIIKWSLERLGDLLRKFGVTVGALVVPALDFAGGEVKDFAANLKKDFGDSADAAVRSMAEMATKLLQSLKVAVPEMNVQTEAAARGIQNMGRETAKVAETVPSLWQRIATAVGQSAEAMAADMKKAMNGIGASVDETMSGMRRLRDETMSSLGSMTGQLVRGEISFAHFVENVVAGITMMIAKMIAFRALAPVFGGPFAGSFLGGFATGGFISPGDFGLVGERGPEFISGGRSGVTVTPISTTASGGGRQGSSMSFVNSFSGMDFGDETHARRIARMILRQVRDGAPEGLDLAAAVATRSEQRKRRAF